MRSKLQIFCILIAILFYSPAIAKKSQKINGGKVFKEALRLFKTGKYKESRHLLNKLALKYPKNSLYYFNLGNADFMLGNLPKEVSSYEKVLELESPLSLPAKLYIVKARISMNQCVKASTVLASLSVDGMPSAIAEEYKNLKLDVVRCLLETGIYYYRNRLYRESIRFFDATLAISDNSDAHMMKGLALLRSGRASGARFSFNKVLEHSGGRFNEDFKNYARDFIKELDDGMWMLKRYYMLRGLFAFKLNSNVYAIGDDDDTSSRASVILNLDGAYRYVRASAFSAYIYGGFLFEEVFGLSALRFLESNLSMPLIYHRKALHLKINTPIRHIVLKDKTFGLKAGSELLFQYGKNRKIGASYSYLRDFSFNETYKYLEGNYQKASFFAAFMNSGCILKPDFRIIAEQIGTLVDSPYILPLANISYGPGFRLS
jgi:tetratricopeptide (TPR) repeat protein